MSSMNDSTRDPGRIEADLVEFVSSRAASEEAIAPQTDLLENDLLDSLLIMDLVAHIESAHGVQLSNADIAPRNFRSVSALAALIARKGSE